MNQTITKHFSDTNYGGNEQALKAAILFRDAKLKELDNTDYELWKRRVGKHPHNTSGMTGVGRYTSKYKNRTGGINEYASWQAFWKDKDGKRQLRTFLVNTYGEEGAKQRAIEARERAMIEMYGKPDITTESEAQKSESFAKTVCDQAKQYSAAKPRVVTGTLTRDSFKRYSTLKETFVDYPYWRAAWNDPLGYEKSCRFTVYKYGEEEARRLALQALEKALKDMINPS
jgi:hypothetical protein